ncbi:IS630 transposase-related protein [Legionella antarctica]|uniref:IS630 transposase-related protein n=1 Tax=Legionella antarctica TaxID=2708020 RepID=UPI001566A389
MNIKSIDLRERVISFIESGGRIIDACSLFQVSSSSVYRWRRLKNNAGNLALCLPIRTAYKINEDALTNFRQSQNSCALRP